MEPAAPPPEPLQPLLQQKALLRQELKARRALVTRLERETQCGQLQTLLLGHLRRQYLPLPPGGCLGVYLSLPAEVSLDDLIRELLGQGVPLAAPRVDMDAGRMEFHALCSLERVEQGPWGVRQPPASGALHPGVVLVPGLGFDALGGRLGMGGGWYDRILPTIPQRIGVCFERQMVPRVPLEPHDCRVGAIVTETRWREVPAAA